MAFTMGAGGGTNMAKNIECTCTDRFTCGYCLRNAKPYFSTPAKGPYPTTEATVYQASIEIKRRTCGPDVRYKATIRLPHVEVNLPSFDTEQVSLTDAIQYLKLEIERTPAPIR